MKLFTIEAFCILTVLPGILYTQLQKIELKILHVQVVSV